MLVWDCLKLEWESFVKNNILSGKTNLKLTDFYGWQDMYPFYGNVYTSYHGESGNVHKTRRWKGCLKADDCTRKRTGMTRVVFVTDPYEILLRDLMSEKDVNSMQYMVWFKEFKV